MSCRTLPSLLFCALTSAGAIIEIASGQTVANPPRFDFVTIGAVNNPAYSGTPGDPSLGGYARVLGRGSVSYEYRLSRTELTHAQYVSFVNVLATRPNNPVSQFMRNTSGFTSGPAVVGLRTNLNYAGPGQLYEVSPGAANWPVLGMSWRQAAMYCNWLHNGMQDNPLSITSGAYDIHTFNNSLQWTDQITKSPGARFWIPTLDEWIKGAHYDPHRHGLNQGGYWLYPTSRDTPPLPGLPSVGGQYFSGISERNPVGLYPAFASPWGLFDTAGSGDEWTEGVFEQGSMFASRLTLGGNLQSAGQQTAIHSNGAMFPWENILSTLRVATIPSPSTVSCTVLATCWFGRNRRYRT